MEQGGLETEPGGQRRPRRLRQASMQGTLWAVGEVHSAGLCLGTACGVGLDASLASASSDWIFSGEGAPLTLARGSLFYFHLYVPTNQPPLR